MSTFLRSFAALIAVGAMGSAALGMSATGVAATSAISSHSAKRTATLIAIAASSPSPNSTIYDQ
jgi:hypothetical protein